VAVYSHLGTFRHRSEVDEYRVDQHFERLGDQLIRLGFDRKIGTDPRWTPETRPPLQLKSKRGKAFRSGPGATRTRDLLLRSAGRTVSRRQRAMRPSDLDDGGAYWR
jgi:hypothetical protein